MKIGILHRIMILDEKLGVYEKIYIIFKKEEVRNRIYKIDSTLFLFLSVVS